MQDLEKFKNEMNLSGKNVYVGHRYVPKIMGEWDNTQIYEPLSIVQYQGNSFSSRQYVPVGVELTNEEYWASTGNYNAQIEQYRQDVRNLENDVNNFYDEVITARNGEETLSERLDKDQQNVNDKLAQISINVKSIFGAVGDGVSNDTDALMNALNYASNNSIKKVYLPSGTYLVDPNKIVIPVNVTLTGSTYRDTIIKATSQSGFGVRLSEGSTIQDLYVRGFTIGIENYSHWTKIYDCKASYNKVGISFNNGSYIVKCKNNEVTFNNIGVLVGRETYELIIKDNVIDNNDLGIGIHSASIGAIISDNTIEGNRNKSTGVGCGVLISGTNLSRTLLSGNWFEANGETETSVDVMVSPYTPSNSEPYALNLYNTIIDQCVPTEYQSLFKDKMAAVGNLLLKENTHIFTKHGVVVGGADRLDIKISDSYFKGVLNKNNVPVYLGIKDGVIARVTIENNNLRNSDNVLIDSQMTKGVKGTYVYSNSVLTSNSTKVILEGSPLFTLITTFEDLLSKSSVVEIKPVSTGVGELTKKSILDKKYIGYTVTNSSSVEIIDVNKGNVPLLDGVSTESYFIPIGDKRTEVRYQNETGNWLNQRITTHDVFPIKKIVPMLNKRVYIGDGHVVYLMLVISKENYDKYFKMVNDIYVYDIHTQLI